MTQPPAPDPTAPAGNGTSDHSLALPPGEPLPEPAVERSRFSLWLASFGLGELQNPLLTSARPPVPRRSGSQ